MAFCHTVARHMSLCCQISRNLDFLQSRYLIRCMSSTSAPNKSESPTRTSEAGKKISQAMKSYLERAKAHTTFMNDEIAEYEIGKRHLAVIMGEDPDTFSQEEIDQAIRYLLPSGLYDKKARPILRHPTEVIPARKEAQFGIDGRPFHSMFYTGKPNFYRLLHDAGLKLEELQQYEDKQLILGLRPSKAFQFSQAGSQWISKAQLEKLVTEKISEGEYVRFTKLMNRLVRQNYAAKESDFASQFRKDISSQSMLEDIPPLLHDEDGRGYIDARGTRKSATTNVRVWEKGTGKFTVNGKNLLEFFPSLEDRQQILFPLQFCDVVDIVDVVATIEGGVQPDSSIFVHSAHAGALRLAIARALQSMVSKEFSEKMRIAGLLTRDPRRRERKKPGQEGARRKFTWKKR